MLGAWRAHGLDDVLRKAWRKGIVLCGPSAGSLCWFEQALSAFHGAPRRVRGLGLLPYSNCVHYDAEPARRAEYHRFVADGMRAGFAAEDGVALHFRRTRLERAVSSRAGRLRLPRRARRRRRRRDAAEVTYLGERAAGRPRQSRPPRRRAAPTHGGRAGTHAVRTAAPALAPSAGERLPVAPEPVPA